MTIDLRLKKSFYLHHDVIDTSRQLLGKFLCTCIGGDYTSGMIVETEAYRAPEDRGSHAFGGRRTDRTEIFFAEGGVAYVYLIYGMYRLFNVVVNQKDIPHAILIRAIEPVEGIELMMQRRGMTTLKPNLTAGPGLLTIALGIGMEHNGADLQGNTVWIEDRGVKVPASKIIASPRVGMNFEGPFRDIPWRFRIKDNKWTSPAK